MQESDRGNVAFLKFQLHVSTFCVCVFASSMLADDLKLSSDEDDAQKVCNTFSFPLLKINLNNFLLLVVDYTMFRYTKFKLH